MQAVYGLTCSFFYSVLGFQAMFGLYDLDPTVCVATSFQFFDIKSYNTAYRQGYTFKLIIFNKSQISRDKTRRGQFRCSARQCSPEHVPSA